jgi:nucleoside-triphosphatase
MDEARCMARILLLTGAPGVGKTTLLGRVLAALQEQRVGGFTTGEVRAGGRRVGFRIVPHRGSERIMAHVERRGSPRVGRYGVDVKAIDEVARESLALDPQVEIYLVDEIGKMECFSQQFVLCMRNLFASEKTIVATIGRSSGGFIAAARSRPGAELWEVTPSNREALVKRVLTWLGQKS